MLIFTSVSLLTLLAAPAAAFWRLPCKSTLVVERADPIVAPGNVSGHVHQIMGGNGFDFEMDYADTQASTCSSCTVKGDFSNYWTPVLYYQGQDGSFQKVDQVGGGLVYYLQRRGPNNDKLQAFPEGFRMVAGDPFKRSGGNDFASQAISYNCLDYDKKGGNPETPNFPNTNCPNGLRAQVFFPSCWDGKNLDSPDHKSHMAYPVGAYNDGKCPDTHPVHLVSIFFEILWDTNKFKSQWYGNSQPFVWAQGDSTGYGLHGDFLMGWDRDLLQRAVDQCTNDSGRVEDCPVFSLYADSMAEGCKIPPKIDEDIKGPFAKLPGCNAVTNGPDRAPIVKTCDGNTAVVGEAKSYFKDLTSSGWAYQGCGTDNYYSRALTGASTSQDIMTNDQCIKFCGDKGFSVAGTQYSKECYCANSIPQSAQPIAGVIGNCDMPCAGDSTQMCGGPSKLSLYTKCTGGTCTNAGGASSSKPSQTSGSLVLASSISSSQVIKAVSTTTSTSVLARGVTSTASTSTNPSSSPTSASIARSSPTASKSATPSPNLPPNWTYQGCITDTLNPRTLPKLAPYKLDNMEVTCSSCAKYCSAQGFTYAGTEYGGECWCSSSLPSNVQKLDEGRCNMACKGDGSQKCGGGSALSLFAAGGVPKLAARDVQEEPVLIADLARKHLAEHKARRHVRHNSGHA